MGKHPRKEKSDQFIVETYNMNPPGYSGIKNPNPVGFGNLKTDKLRMNRDIEFMWSEKQAGRGNVLSEKTKMLRPFVPNFEDQ